jgi:hypothetical protein
MRLNLLIQVTTAVAAKATVITLVMTEAALRLKAPAVVVVGEPPNAPSPPTLSVILSVSLHIRLTTLIQILTLRERVVGCKYLFILLTFISDSQQEWKQQPEQ